MNGYRYDISWGPLPGTEIEIDEPVYRRWWQVWKPRVAGWERRTVVVQPIRLTR